MTRPLRWLLLAALTSCAAGAARASAGRDATAATPAAAAARDAAPPPAAAYQVETGSTFQAAPGVKIWYEVRGSGAGTPLVIANGGPGFDHSYLHCTDAWDRLAGSRRVIFYDQRGNGRSGALPEGAPCGVAEQIADLDALRAHLGFQKID